MSVASRLHSERHRDYIPRGEAIKVEDKNHRLPSKSARFALFIRAGRDKKDATNYPDFIFKS
jgi:hypothetical protein